MKVNDRLSLLAGLAATANFSLYPPLENAPRLLDVFVVIMSVIALFHIATKYFTKGAVFIVFASLFFYGWAIFGLILSDTSLVIASVRLASTLLAVISINLFLQGDSAFENFLLGGAIGAAIVSCFAVGQKLDLGDFFFSVIPAGTPTWWVNGGELRAVGIYQHPNGLTQGQVIGAVMALTLIWKEYRRYVGYALFSFIIVSTYFATSTRAGIVAAVFSFLIVHTLHPSGRYKSFTVILAWPFIVIAAVLSPELLGDRWTGVSTSGLSLSENLFERLGTNVNSLIGIFTHPIGLGVDGRAEFMREISYGISASHNSYLSFGLTFGLVPLLVLIGTVLHRLLKGKRNMLYPMFMVIVFQLLAEDSIFSGSVQFGLILSVFGGIKFLHMKGKVEA